MKLTIKKFKTIIFSNFIKHGRILPWRYEKDPYKILISEVMLQQTQVSRVVPKYHEWIQHFSTVESLANASLRDVLSAWQGLGYNRRGKYLKETAQIIMKDKKYRFMFRHPKRVKRVEGSSAFQVNQRNEILHPPSRDQNDMISLLEELPGIGQATASAIITYAFNKPTVFIETNIRSVYLFFFFKQITRVSDKQLADMVEKTMDYENPREWYYALTDYGNFLKTKEKFKNTQSKHYIKQPPFKGSKRELRGLIIKIITISGSVTIQEIEKESNFIPVLIEKVLTQMVKEGLIRLSESVYKIHH